MADELIMTLPKLLYQNTQAFMADEYPKNLASVPLESSLVRFCLGMYVHRLCIADAQRLVAYEDSVFYHRIIHRLFFL
jgi:hypothetical protein